MPKILTAGMTWIANPGPALRIKNGYYSKSAPATVLNSIRTINSTSHQQITVFYSTPIRKSKGTSYCSRNSYYSQQSWQITVAVGGNSIHPSKSRIPPWFQQLSAASDAPFSLFKGAHSSVFSRLKTSTLPTEVNILPLQQRFFIAEIP